MTRIPRLLASIVLFAAASVSAFAAGDAASSPQAKAYEAHVKAQASGDYQAFRAGMSKTALEMMDKQNKDMNLDPKKMMEMMKEMAPKDLKVEGLKVDGKKATLDVTGKVGGENNWGTVQMEDESGQWKVTTESWTNTPKKK